MQLSLDDLEISVRLHTIFRQEGLRLADVLKMADWEILGLPNLGIKSLNDLKDALQKEGLSLAKKDRIPLPAAVQNVSIPTQQDFMVLVRRLQSDLGMLAALINRMVAKPSVPPDL